jgi:hypothetical protein
MFNAKEYAKMISEHILCALLKREDSNVNISKINNN